MFESLKETSSPSQLLEQQKKQIMAHIKELQRQLIKASFNSANGSGEHAKLLQLINAEREKIKQLNKPDLDE
jgi:hypothetical protein